MKEHRWVRHTIEEVYVLPVALAPVILTLADSDRRTVVGCDDCGLIFSSQLMHEPCLGDLEDEIESP